MDKGLARTALFLDTIIVLKVTFIFISHYHLGTCVHFSQVPSSLDFKLPKPKEVCFQFSLGEHHLPIAKPQLIGMSWE